MVYKILPLFIISQLMFVAAIVAVKNEVLVFGILFGLIAIVINTLLALIAWNKLILPFKKITDANSDLKLKNKVNLSFSVSFLCEDINHIIAESDNKSRRSFASFEKNNELINLIGEDLKSIDSYSKHMTANDEELDFEPKLIEQAFAQSISAADYATSTFEQIYMSISNLGEGYNSVREQSTNLQQSANAAQVQVQTTKNNVTKLSIAANEINEVTKSISDIASMTQLLALNASIEAARAGESGRGFAVVADEVKKLASQTDKATKRISDISNGILSSSQESAESIRKIDENTKEINGIITSVFGEIENQWGDVQGLLGQMGQAAGTVSGLKGILMSSENELKSHFIMLEGVYLFAKESGKTVKQLSTRLGINLTEIDKTKHDEFINGDTDDNDIDKQAVQTKYLEDAHT